MLIVVLSTRGMHVTNANALDAIYAADMHPHIQVTARADLGGGGTGVGPPPPFPKCPPPPFFEEIIPMKLNFIIRLS